jgi:CRISPR system Cascade subunit CasC
MANILELHVLQNYAPSNLNRDDTGAPKDAMFGGARRARISSQCQKRAVRNYFGTERLLPDDRLSLRTRNIVSEIVEKLKAVGIETVKAEKIAEEGLKVIKLAVKKKKDEVAPQTEYLLFLGKGEIEKFAKVLIEFSDSLSSGNPTAEAKSAIKDAIGSVRAADIALFGRMVADAKNFNVDAACQVAHAISTHRVDREFDFFTAVDDRVGADEAVSGMLGTVEFNSACYYRYAVIHLDKLAANLDGDKELSAGAVAAFTKAFIEANPSGKQNSFAALNPPDFIAVRLRDGMAINLSNAFERPVYSNSTTSLTSESVSRLKERWDVYADAFGGESRDLVLDLTGTWGNKSTVPNSRSLVDGARALTVEVLEG